MTLYRQKIMDAAAYTESQQNGYAPNQRMGRRNNRNKVRPSVGCVSCRLPDGSGHYFADCSLCASAHVELFFSRRAHRATCKVG